MMRLNWKLVRRALCAVVLLALSAELASAAPARLRSNTNLRMGPGTHFGVIATIPGGTLVNIIRCGGEWCNATWRGRPGYLIRRNLLRGSRAVVRRPVVVAPAPVVVAPAPVVVYGGPFWGPHVYVGPRRGWRRW